VITFVVARWYDRREENAMPAFHQETRTSNPVHPNSKKQVFFYDSKLVRREGQV
jgi:hypothetical protein